MDSLAYMLASGGDDDSLKLWFWLIVGAIFLIKKVIEFLKPKEKDEETPVLDTEDHHEKRVKEVIAEMRRTKPEWTAETAQQTAQNVLERYVKATEEARQSMRSLSDAEQAALHRLQEREMKESRPEPLPTVAASEPLSLKNSLRRSQSLKTAILYQEILGKPRALRGISFSGE